MISQYFEIQIVWIGTRTTILKHCSKTYWGMRRTWQMDVWLTKSRQRTAWQHRVPRHWFLMITWWKWTWWQLIWKFPADPNPNKQSPYIHRDHVIGEEDKFENIFVDFNEEFGFKNLISYIKQMDRLIEEGKSFK